MSGESEDVDDILNEAAERCQEIKLKLLKAVDEDTNAFNQYMDAMRLPKKTDEEKKKRTAAMQEGLKSCSKSALFNSTIKL
ncbi:MAG: cyclodeaminase/cyclohydrolase family protein [Melioribacteraceae bacterium]|nr:cyclodeaminase/cyclohydrolase family protein [Melioribacteraceae bacterium]